MGTYHRDKIDFYVETYTTDCGEVIKSISVDVNGEEVVLHAENLQQAVKKFDYWFEGEKNGAL
jgi:hypothetical protein